MNNCKHLLANGRISKLWKMSKSNDEAKQAICHRQRHHNSGHKKNMVTNELEAGEIQMEQWKKKDVVDLEESDSARFGVNIMSSRSFSSYCNEFRLAPFTV